MSSNMHEAEPFNQLMSRSATGISSDRDGPKYVEHHISMYIAKQTFGGENEWHGQAIIWICPISRRAVIIFEMEN